MERIANPEIEQAEPENAEPNEGAEVIRLWPISVLLVSPDRCWRSTVAMLSGRRERAALSAEDEREAIEIASRERVDVVVLERPPSESPGSWDAYVQGLVASIGFAMAQRGARVAPVGVVVVSEPPRPEGSSQSLDLDKWGPFGELFGAIARADRARRLPREERLQSWPAALRVAAVE